MHQDGGSCTYGSLEPRSRSADSPDKTRGCRPQHRPAPDHPTGAACTTRWVDTAAAIRQGAQRQGRGTPGPPRRTSRGVKGRPGIPYVATPQPWRSGERSVCVGRNVARQAAARPSTRRSPAARALRRLLAALLAAAAWPPPPPPPPPPPRPSRSCHRCSNRGLPDQPLHPYARSVCGAGAFRTARRSSRFIPNATRSRVRASVQGAKLLIYGPRERLPNPTTRRWIPKGRRAGSNPYAGSGNTKTTLLRQSYIDRYIQLAPQRRGDLNQPLLRGRQLGAGQPEPQRHHRPEASRQHSRPASCGRARRRSSPRRWATRATSSRRSSPPTRRCPTSSGARRAGPGATGLRSPPPGRPA